MDDLVDVLLELSAVAFLMAFAVIVWPPLTLIVAAVSFLAIAWRRSR